MKKTHKVTKDEYSFEFLASKDPRGACGIPLNGMGISISKTWETVTCKRCLKKRAALKGNP